MEFERCLNCNEILVEGFGYDECLCKRCYIEGKIGCIEGALNSIKDKRKEFQHEIDVRLYRINEDIKWIKSEMQRTK